MKNKLKNYGLWVSVFSLVGLILSDYSTLPANFDQYVQAVLSILVLAGIISSPNEGKWYKDDTNNQDVSEHHE